MQGEHGNCFGETHTSTSYRGEAREHERRRSAPLGLVERVPLCPRLRLPICPVSLESVQQRVPPSAKNPNNSKGSKLHCQ